jgi:hypothetical protein
MEIAKYATGLLLVVGCGAPEAGDASASNRGSMVGAEEERVLQAGDFGVQGSALKKKPKSLEVNFGDCTEFAGLTFVPTEAVESLVPPEYELAHFTTVDEAVVVVRVANCNSVRVKGGKARAGTVAQVGVTLAGPDATSDINNYTLWYVTDNKELAHELSKLGVDAEYSTHVDYDFAGGSGSGAFDISVAAHHAPDYALSGTATAPTDPAVPFVASWWYDTCQGTVQMRTDLPQIRFGASAMTLTATGADLQDIVGSGPVTFPALDSYNTFSHAEMIVTVD